MGSWNKILELLGDLSPKVSRVQSVSWPSCQIEWSVSIRTYLADRPHSDQPQRATLLSWSLFFPSLDPPHLPLSRTLSRESDHLKQQKNDTNKMLNQLIGKSLDLDWVTQSLLTAMNSLCHAGIFKNFVHPGLLPRSWPRHWKKIKKIWFLLEWSFMKTLVFCKNQIFVFIKFLLKN